MMDVTDQTRVNLNNAMKKVTELLEINLDDDVPAVQAANTCILFQIKSNDQQHRMEIYERTVQILEPYANKLKEFMDFQDEAIKRFAEEVRHLAHKDQKNFFINQSYLVTLGKMIKMFALLDEMKNMKASMKNDYSNYKRATQFLQRHDPSSMEESQRVSVFLATQKSIRDTLKNHLNKVDGYEDLLIEIINNSAHMYLNKVYVLPEEKHTHVIVIAFSLYLLDSSRVVDGKNVGVNVNKLGRRLNLSKLDHILKECEVVNMFGDMSVEPFAYVRQTPSFDASKWPDSQSSKVSSQGSLLMHMTRFKDEYTSLTSDLAWHTNITSTRTNEPTIRQNQELYELALRGLQYLSAWSVQVLDTFTWKLAHCASHQTNRDCPKTAESYEKATKYNYNSQERFAMIELISMIKSVQTQLLRLETYYSEAIRRSIYRELQLLVVAHLNAPLVKAQKKKDRINLVRLIHAIQATCADWTFDRLPDIDAQSFTGSVSVHSKSKGGWSRGTISGAKFGSSNSGGSGHNSITNGSNTALASFAASLGSGSGESSSLYNSGDLAKRRVAPSSSQLYLVRAMLELMIDQTASGKNVMRKELDPNTLAVVEDFLKNSFYWPYLLSFSETLIKCCDLSQLWYREFFLELTNGACIQFPIEMSLPWIFTDHILETEHVGFIEHILYPLDLYNDAAECALNRFHRQFLFNEIEAEANLVFDQLVYKLSDRIFKHYKSYAASILLDKRFRAEAHRVGWREAYPPPNRFAAALLAQRNVQLIGRTIDLTRLITQRMNTAIHKSIKELEANLACTRLCHRMLSEHLDLDNFDALFREANEQVTSPLGLVTVHVFWELTYDLVRNYCYNDATNRFVRTRFTLNEELEREKPEDVEPQYIWGSRSLNSCYEAIFNLYRGFVGAPHFSAICRLLGYRGLFVVITEMMKVAQSLLNQTLRDYVIRLIPAMPTNPVELPGPTIKSDAAFSALYKSLSRIYQCPDLRTTGCQNFRELGNIVITCLQLEKCLSIEDACDLRHAGPFIGQLPKPFIPPLSQSEAAQNDATVRLQAKREMIYKELQKKQESMNVVNVVSKIGPPEQLALAKENEVFTKERLCSGLKLFDHVLNRLQEFLAEEDSSGRTWHSFTPPGSKNSPNHDILDLMSCTQFHRIWSAIQLVFCTPPGQNEYTVEEMFGEGLNWAGCVIIFLLGQQRRFELLDFGGHLLRLQRVDQKDATREGISLERMATRLSRFSVLNRQIFATLKTHRFFKDQQAAKEMSFDNVRHFPPPI